jgi:hypothetical protein
MKYIVKKKWRNLENGQPKGAWIYHDLFKTENESEAFEYIKTCPEDKQWAFYVIQSSRGWLT